MPHARISCLAPGLKVILERESRHIENPLERKAFEQLVSSMMDCQNGEVIGLEIEGEGLRGGKNLRKRSAYQNFVSECASEGKNSLKECAAQWNGMSPLEKERFQKV